MNERKISYPVLQALSHARAFPKLFLVKLVNSWKKKSLVLSWTRKFQEQFSFGGILLDSVKSSRTFLKGINFFRNTAVNEVQLK